MNGPGRIRKKGITMANDFEMAFRQMLKSVVQEVLDELFEEHTFQAPQIKGSQDSTPGDDGLLLRTREAAKRLAISERLLFKLTSDGTIPCVRIGRLVHYSVATIEKWIRDTESTDRLPKRTGRQLKQETSLKVSVSKPKARPKQKRQSKVTETPLQSFNNTVEERPEKRGI
jgi:excisionase family DNA binding protein